MKRPRHAERGGNREDRNDQAPPHADLLFDERPTSAGLSHMRQRSVSEAVGRGWPSGPMIVCIQTECFPFLADMPVTEMESPGLSVRFVQPTRPSLFGDVSSPCQGSASPLSVFASKYTSTCGL